MNNVVLIGRIANDLELKGGENKVVNFNLAVSRQKKDETDFIPVAVFGKQAESICQYQVKGNRLAVQGFLRQENYTLEDGSKRNTFKVIANRVEFLESKPKEDTNYTEYKAIVEDAKVLDVKIDDEDIPF